MAVGQSGPQSPLLSWHWLVGPEALPTHLSSLALSLCQRLVRTESEGFPLLDSASSLLSVPGVAPSPAPSKTSCTPHSFSALASQRNRHNRTMAPSRAVPREVGMYVRAYLGEEATQLPPRAVPVGSAQPRVAHWGLFLPSNHREALGRGAKFLLDLICPRL